VHRAVAELRMARGNDDALAATGPRLVQLLQRQGWYCATIKQLLEDAQEPRMRDCQLDMGHYYRENLRWHVFSSNKSDSNSKNDSGSRSGSDSDSDSSGDSDSARGSGAAAAAAAAAAQSSSRPRAGRPTMLRPEQWQVSSLRGGLVSHSSRYTLANHGVYFVFLLVYMLPQQCLSQG
jgi:hypothetical protein